MSLALHYWIGDAHHCSGPPVSEMTYTVSSGTLNPCIPYHTSVTYGKGRLTGAGVWPGGVWSSGLLSLFFNKWEGASDRGAIDRGHLTVHRFTRLLLSRCRFKKKANPDCEKRCPIRWVMTFNLKPAAPATLREAGDIWTRGQISQAWLRAVDIVS